MNQNRTRQGGIKIKSYIRLQPLYLSSLLQRIKVYKADGQIRMTGDTTIIIQNNTTAYEEQWSSCNKYEFYVRKLKGERQAARKVIMTHSIDGILESLKRGTDLTVSDG